MLFALITIVTLSTYSVYKTLSKGDHANHYLNG